MVSVFVIRLIRSAIGSSEFVPLHLIYDAVTFLQGYVFDTDTPIIIIGITLYNKRLNIINIATIIIGVTYYLYFAGLASVVVLSVCSLFVLLCVDNKMILLEFSPLVAFGNISFTLFLIHQNIGYIILNIMNSKQILYIIVPSIIMICASFFIELGHNRVETLIKKYNII